MRDGTEALIRPIRPEDARTEEEFAQGLSEESAFFRAFGIPKEPTLEMIARLRGIDYEKETVMAAEMSSDGRRVLAGVARILETAKNGAEFAVVVADEFQGRGLGSKLTCVTLESPSEMRLASVCAAITPENTAMISLAKKSGFRIVHEDDKAVIAELPPSSYEDLHKDGVMLPTTGGAREVVIFSKRGCHLCEAVEAEIRSTALIGTRVTVVNIDEDPVLHDMYWLRVPVVRVEGEDVFEARMIDQEGEWKKRLARLLG